MKRAFVILGSLIFMGCADNHSEIDQHMSDTTHAEHNVRKDSSERTMMSLMNMNMQQMQVLPTTGNPDADFAGMMKIHHEGAVEMAQLQLEKGQDPELRKMAENIMKDQQQEIQVLGSFTPSKTDTITNEAFHREVLTQMQTMKMDHDPNGSVDKQFVEMMIPHHQGAIDMVNAYLKNGATDAKLKSMAKQMVVEQEREIKQMKDWLAKH
jgi:uncharacterized protein (DUF305 family)